MLLFNHPIVFFVISLSYACTVVDYVKAEEQAQDKISAAVDVVRKLCLSGSEYGISADVEGNISIKDFKPKGSGSLIVNVREAGGATALQEHLRIIGDKEVRECTQKHIGRILDAIFETTPPKLEQIRKNKSIQTARFLGYVPSEIVVTDFVEGKDVLFYRFTVKEPSTYTVIFEKNERNLNAYIYTGRENEIAVERHIRSGQGIRPHFLVPGDYYIKVNCSKDREAIGFQMFIKEASLQ